MDVFHTPTPTQCRPLGTSSSEELCQTSRQSSDINANYQLILTESAESGSSHTLSPGTNRSGLSMLLSRIVPNVILYLCLRMLVRYVESVPVPCVG